MPVVIHENLLTLREAAKILRIHVGTLRRWLREGEIPFVKLAGSRIRVQSDALMTYIRRHDGVTLRNAKARKEGAALAAARKAAG